MSAAADAFSNQDAAENDDEPLIANDFMTDDEQNVIIALVAQMKGEMPKDTLISMVKGIILIEGIVGEEDIDVCSAEVTQNLIETRGIEEEAYDGIDYVFVDSDDFTGVSVRPVGDDAPDMDADMDANADVDEAV
jgi:hypothetical protein